MASRALNLDVDAGRYGKGGLTLSQDLFSSWNGDGKIALSWDKIKATFKTEGGRIQSGTVTATIGETSVKLPLDIELKVTGEASVLPIELTLAGTLEKVFTVKRDEQSDKAAKKESGEGQQGVIIAKLRPSGNITVKKDAVLHEDALFKVAGKPPEPGSAFLSWQGKLSAEAKAVYSWYPTADKLTVTVTCTLAVRPLWATGKDEDPEKKSPPPGPRPFPDKTREREKERRSTKKKTPEEDPVKPPFRPGPFPPGIPTLNGADKKNRLVKAGGIYGGLAGAGAAVAFGLEGAKDGAIVGAALGPAGVAIGAGVGVAVGVGVALVVNLFT